MHKLGIWLLLLAFLGPVLATPAFAEDEKKPAPAEQAEEEAADGMSATALDDLLSENPDTLMAIVLLKFVPLGIGVILLVLWWLKRDKIRGGALPAPAPVTPTAPFPTTTAFFLVIAGMMLLPAIFTGVLMGSFGSGEIATETTAGTSETAPAETNEAADEAEPAPEEEESSGTKIPLWIQIVAMGIGSIPVAVFVLVRRARAQRAVDEAGQPLASPAPGLGRAFLLGMWGFCVATAFVVPISMVWVLFLETVGPGAELQDLVQKVYGPGPAYVPWMIAIFGVCVAPLVEETFFRGALYPAIRKGLGGSRKAAWISALLVSAIFAAIHGNWTALVPLFVLALVLTWVMEATNSLAACVIAHAIHNAFALVPLLVLRAS